MTTPFTAYRGSEPYTFVCYAHDDKGIVYREMEWLHQREINLWYDEGIEPGTNWRTEIGVALENATQVLFFISRRSLASNHCNREINYALDQGKKILPVYIEDAELTTDLRVGLSRVQALRTSELSTPELRTKILVALNPTHDPAVDPTDIVGVPRQVYFSITSRYLVVITLLIVSAVGFWRYGVTTTGRTIAVLPFETLGEDKASTFTEGIHLGVLTRLSEVSGLDVISRTSVMAYTKTQKTLPTIAGELGVIWVLRADVQEAAGDIQLNARLLDASSDRQVWARNYRRTLTAENVFEIQAELSKLIIEALQARLSPAEERRIAQIPTRDLEAYRLQLLGRKALDLRTEEGLQRAVEYFRKAIDRDADYALAWVGLADAFSLIYDYGFQQKSTVLAQAEEAVNRALQLDSNLAEAQASSGLLLSNRRQGAEAITKLVRATELRPSYAEAHNWLAWVQQLLGRPTEGLESAVLSVSLDPLSSEAVSNLALSYLTTGDYEAALTEARRVQEILPGWGTAALYEGVALLHLGRFAESQAVLQGLRVAWAGSAAQATLALILEGTGDTSATRNQITHQLEQGELFSAGLLHAALGEKEQAMSLFLRIDRWDSWPTLAMRYLYPEILGSVRLDSQYPDLLKRINHSWGIEEPG